jgi:hypothetical protein
MSGGSVVFQLFSHVFDRFHHIRIAWRAFYTFFNVNYCNVLGNHTVCSLKTS